MTKLSIEVGARLDVVLQALCPECKALGTQTFEDCRGLAEAPPLGSVYKSEPLGACSCDGEVPAAEWRVVAYRSGWINPHDDDWGEGEQ